MSVYLWYLAIDFGIQWIAFVVAATLQTEKFYDITGSLTFVTLALFAYKWSNAMGTRKAVQTGLLLIWALRLGTYLFTRILHDGKDRRFDRVRNNPPKFFVFWTLQGVWVIVTLLPSLVMLSNPIEESLNLKEILGWSIFAAGFTMEAIADHQKSVFRKNPLNQDKFIHSGLWSVSRHPNYFGEILLWFGLFISASSGFSHLHILQRTALLCCPLFDALLITLLSGIPHLEKAANKKWGP